ncbi:MAG: sulfatase-like hydrolase/transferase [Anaerolineae bacterium]|nr:sulfatase-like hydrolase/transferase [Anaerolineae bacterium]
MANPINERHPNVVLALCDSMRARNLSCYGYAKPTTPCLDELARHGVRFAKAFTQAPFTTASVASLLTGVYPSVHGIQHYGQRLAEDWLTLPELLQEGGYQTAAFVANPHINQQSGMARGFDCFLDGRPFYKRGRLVAPFVAWAESGRKLNELVKKHLRQMDDRPFFFFVFYNDSHVPFSALPRVLLPLVGRRYHTPDFEKQRYTDSDMIRIVDMYDRSLWRADRYVGQLWDMIRHSQYASSTVFIVSADHGEGLDRRPERAGHGRLYESGIHVPLVVQDPRTKAGKVISEMVTSLDIAPTICELSGQKIPSQFQGQSLAPCLKGDGSDPIHEHVVAEYHDCRCIRTNRWKLIVRGAGIGVPVKEPLAAELYDLENDPWEESDLAQTEPQRVMDLIAELKRTIDDATKLRNAPLSFKRDDLVVERLRGLGYID